MSEPTSVAALLMAVAVNAILGAAPVIADAPDEVAALLRQLGQKESTAREAAADALKKLGPAAWPQLRAAMSAKGVDPELANSIKGVLAAQYGVWGMSATDPVTGTVVSMEDNGWRIRGTLDGRELWTVKPPNRCNGLSIRNGQVILTPVPSTLDVGNGKLLRLDPQAKTYKEPAESPFAVKAREAMGPPADVARLIADMEAPDEKVSAAAANELCGLGYEGLAAIQRRMAKSGKAAPPVFKKAAEKIEERLAEMRKGNKLIVCVPKPVSSGVGGKPMAHRTFVQQWHEMSFTDGKVKLVTLLPNEELCLLDIGDANAAALLDRAAGWTEAAAFREGKLLAGWVRGFNDKTVAPHGFLGLKVNLEPAKPEVEALAAVYARKGVLAKQAKVGMTVGLRLDPCGDLTLLDVFLNSYARLIGVPKAPVEASGVVSPKSSP